MGSNTSFKAATGALIIGLAPTTIVMFVGYAISTLGIAAASAGFNPVLAERVPSAQCGKVGALGGVAAGNANPKDSTGTR